MLKIKLVVAGNYKQARYWTHELQWAPSEWRYVVNREQMLGYPDGTEVHLFGEWWKHPSQKQGHVDPDGSWCSEFAHRIHEGRLVRMEHNPDTGHVVER